MIDRSFMDIFMQAAINEALEGLKEGGVPIGAVLVENGRIIGRGRNRKHIACGGQAVSIDGL